MKPRGGGRTHVNYLVTGGGSCGILFDVVSIAAMKQCLCTDTTKIHTRTPGTTARPSERNKQTNKQTNKLKAKVSFQAFRKTKCNIRTLVAQVSESRYLFLFSFSFLLVWRDFLSSPLPLLSLRFSFSLSFSLSRWLSRSPLRPLPASLRWEEEEEEDPPSAL